MKILIFGNPLVEQDNLILRILPTLKKYFPEKEFIHLDPTESLEQYGPDLTIIDVIHEIENPMIIENLKKLKTQKINSMHDFDLAYNLKLLFQIGKIKSIKIFGIPWNMEETQALKWLKKNLN